MPYGTSSLKTLWRIQNSMVMSSPVCSAQGLSHAGLPILVAAGSLGAAMAAMLQAHAAQGGAHFAAEYGPSGRWHQEIAAGKEVAVFASADAAHTQALAARHILGPSRVFARNALCVLARSTLQLTHDNFLEVLSRPQVRLATSTPVSDPMGDYTWEFFRKADQQQPGLYRLFESKALKLSGATAPAPGTKSPYVTAFEGDQADVYVMYCTNAVSTRQALPQLVSLQIPALLNVPSRYGIAAHPESIEGQRFVNFVLQPQAQAILRQYGFQ